MSTSQLSLKLQPSNSYLVISIFIYGLCLILPWWRLDSFWLNIALTVAIGISAMTYFPKYVLLTKENSIDSIALGDGNTSFSSKGGKTQLQTKYTVTYQSRHLVIIRFGKVRVPIFKDSVEENSLSSLNRFLNIG